MPTRHSTLAVLSAATLLSLAAAAHAQTTDANSIDCSTLSTRTAQMDCADAHGETKTIFLHNVVAQNDANEIMVAIRNTFRPGMQVYFVASQNAIVVRTYLAEMSKVEALIHTLDVPHKTYRLTYTITELDAGKAIGTQHISMIAVDGQRNTLKQGDKIPVATGSYSNEASPTAGTQTQFQYLDIGMNIDATLTVYDNGAILKSKVEQSSLGQPSTIAGVTEPVIRQTVLEGTALLPLGKPVMLGTIDVPNSTHHFDIAVVMDPIK